MKRSSILVTGGLGAALTWRVRRRRHQGGSPAKRYGAPAPLARQDDPDDVLSVLHADHIRLRGMVADLQARPDGRLQEHRAAVRQLHRLVIEATGHEAVEELHFWPVVRERLPDGRGLADTACAQELEQRKLLQRRLMWAPRLRRGPFPFWTKDLATALTTSHGLTVIPLVGHNSFLGCGSPATAKSGISRYLVRYAATSGLPS